MILGRLPRSYYTHIASRLGSIYFSVQTIWMYIVS